MRHSFLSHALGLSPKTVVLFWLAYSLQASFSVQKTAWFQACSSKRWSTVPGPLKANNGDIKDWNVWMKRINKTKTNWDSTRTRRQTILFTISLGWTYAYNKPLKQTKLARRLRTNYVCASSEIVVVIASKIVISFKKN